MFKESKFTAKNQLTVNTLASLPEQHQEHVRAIMAAAGEMGLCVWYDAERYGLLLGTEKRGPLNWSTPLWVKDSGEAANIVTMLGLMRTLYGLDPNIDLGSRLDTLEELLKSMAPAKGKKKPAAKKTTKRAETPKPKKSKAPSKPVTEVELTPERIMEIYRELQPQFLDAGVEFEIIEERVCAQYFNPRSKRHAILYSASANDLRKVQLALKYLQKRSTAKAA